MRFAGVAISTLALSVAVHADGRSALDAAARAMGGKDRVLAVRTLVVEGSGEILYFGQTLTPYAKTNIAVTSFRRTYDFASRRWLLDQMREPPLRVRIGLDGDVAYTIVGDGEATRGAASVAADRSAELVYHPIGFIQAAYAAGNGVTEDMDGNVRRIRLTAGAMSYTMHLDRRTSLPSRISRLVDHPMLGDVALEVELSDWRKTGELQLPMRIVQRENRFVLSDYRMSIARVNEDPGNLAATDSVRAAAPPVDPPVSVAVEEIAPGVWLLSDGVYNGGVYNSIAIEQSDKIVLVEAPISDAVTLAYIAKARELRPGKPLGPVVNTHAHFDHAGGLRAAISQGLAIITLEANSDFYKEMVYAGRHTIKPDALQKNPRPLRLTSVSERLVLRDTERTIELYEVKGSPHSASMLIAYLPAERILIQADLDDPPGFTPALVETVQRLGLNVERVVGIHGRPAPWPVK